MSVSGQWEPWRVCEQGHSQVQLEEGSRQGLALTWAPPMAATPQSGTIPSQPPATPEALPTCCLHCGLWPPCRQSRTGSEVRETEAGQAAGRPQGLPHTSWASHQPHSPGHDTPPHHASFLICNTVDEDWAHFPELQRGLFYKIILEKHIGHDASILGHLGSYNYIHY